MARVTPAGAELRGAEGDPKCRTETFRSFPMAQSVGSAMGKQTRVGTPPLSAEGVFCRRSLMPGTERADCDNLRGETACERRLASPDDPCSQPGCGGPSDRD